MKITFLISMVLVLVVYFGNGVSSTTFCSRNSETLDCLKNNFRKLYAEDYPRFWGIVYETWGRVKKCDSLTDVASFLELVRFQWMNAEFDEFFNYAIETIFVRDASCIVDAGLLIGRPEQKRLINILRHPMFVDEEKIRAEFVRLKKEQRFKEMVDAYFVGEESDKRCP